MKHRGNRYATPPEMEPVHEVLTVAIDAAGSIVLPFNLAEQHSILSAINGIEKEKTEDLAVLGSVG